MNYILPHLTFRTLKTISFRPKLWVVLILTLFVTSCAKEDSRKTVNADGSTLITYWCSSNPHEIELARRLVDAWNIEHHSVKVKLQPIPASQSSEEVLLAAIAGGTTPDVCSNMWPGAMDEFINAGGLVRLDQFDDFFEFNLARVPETLMGTFAASDGHYYQLPWKTNPIMIMYNTKMFREAGIDTMPRTYSELLDAGERITRDLDGDGQIDQWMGYRNIKPIWWQRFFDYYTFYVAASGGLSLFDGDSLIFDNEASVEVFELFRQIYKRGYFPITEFSGDQFVAGKIATSITGPYSIPHVERYKPEGFEYDFFPIPTPDDYTGPVYTYGDHKNISIFSTTYYPQESWEFAKFLISETADSLLLELTSQIPIRKNITSNPMYANYFANNPGMIIFAEQAINTRGVDGASELKEIFDALSQEFEACCLFDARTPRESIRLAAQRSQVIIDWNRAQ